MESIVQPIVITPSDNSGHKIKERAPVNVQRGSSFSCRNIPLRRFPWWKPFGRHCRNSGSFAIVGHFRDRNTQGMIDEVASLKVFSGRKGSKEYQSGQRHFEHHGFEDKE
jgi:hypothetical protein